jgi:uncharacterized cupredoxin-like copper-binding protein
MRTMPRRLLLPVVAVAALALVAAGCGGGGGKKSASTTTAAPATKGGAVTISESEYKLTPSNPKVTKTGVAHFNVRNAGTIAHALEVEGPKGEARLHTLQPGSSGTLTVDFSKPGTYEFYCPIDGHRKLGMRGKVVVASGGKSTSSGGATTTTPSSGGGGGGGGASGY